MTTDGVEVAVAGLARHQLDHHALRGLVGSIGRTTRFIASAIAGQVGLQWSIHLDEAAGQRP